MLYTTSSMVRHASQSFQWVHYLAIPIAVENVRSYAEFHESEMTEWEFLNEVVYAADCGILLDVNNIYVSSQNHGFDPMEYVNAVATDCVAQIHVAGHSKFEKYILDTRDHPVLDPAWRMYERAIDLSCRKGNCRRPVHEPSRTATPHGDRRNPP
jgi:uncharacterized protein (UPF0276 family)